MLSEEGIIHSPRHHPARLEMTVHSVWAPHIFCWASELRIHPQSISSGNFTAYFVVDLNEWNFFLTSLIYFLFWQLILTDWTCFLMPLPSHKCVSYCYTVTLEHHCSEWCLFFTIISFTWKPHALHWEWTFQWIWILCPTYLHIDRFCFFLMR